MVGLPWRRGPGCIPRVFGGVRPPETGNPHSGNSRRRHAEPCSRCRRFSSARLIDSATNQRPRRSSNVSSSTLFNPLPSSCTPASSILFRPLALFVAPFSSGSYFSPRPLHRSASCTITAIATHAGASVLPLMSLPYPRSPSGKVYLRRGVLCFDSVGAINTRCCTRNNP